MAWYLDPDGRPYKGDPVEPHHEQVPDRPDDGHVWDGEAWVERVPTIDDYRAAIEEHVDIVAAERDYSGAVSIATYVSSTNSEWATEAQAFIAWRDAVWAYAFTELAKVMGGQRAQPTVADFIAELPVMEWPE